MIGGPVISEIINTFEYEYFEEYVTSSNSLKRLENTEAHNTKFTEGGITEIKWQLMC